MISGGLCAVAKRDFMRGVHQPNDVYKVALYTPDASLNIFTTEYTTVGEVRAQGYMRGGQPLDGYSCDVDGASGCLTWTRSPVWKNATIAAAGALVYNASKGNAAVAVLEFDQVVSSTNGNWVLPMPQHTAGQALIKWL